MWSLNFRSTSGSSIAEIPFALFFILIGLMLPLIALSTITYQSLILQMAVKDSSRAASRSATWTQAKTNALEVFERDVHAFHGIEAAATPVIVVRAPDNSEKVTPDKLIRGSIDGSESLYLVRVTAMGKLAPLFPGGIWQGLKVPGLTAPMELLSADEVVFENPEALVD